MCPDVIRHTERFAGEVQHGRPEKRMEVGDVLTDDVNLLGCRGFQQSLEIDALGFAVGLQAGEVADRGIQPNVEELARFIGNFNTEVRSVA